MLLSLITSNDFNIYKVIVYILSVLMVIFLINPLHECAHGFVAYKLGDRTAKNMGRLTLNPMAHIDYMGALSMLIIGFGWAKPVPVNSNNFKKPKVGMAISALAGPVSNFLAAIIAGLVCNLILTVTSSSGYELFLYVNNPVMYYVYLFFYYLEWLNICLAVFNLVPIPPLDGSKILMAFLSYKTINKLYQYEMYISIALFVLLFMGGTRFLLPIQNFLCNGIDWLTALPFSWAW